MVMISCGQLWFVISAHQKTLKYMVLQICYIWWPDERHILEMVLDQPEAAIHPPGESLEKPVV